MITPIVALLLLNTAKGDLHPKGYTYLLPPEEGKFFYADFPSLDTFQHGQHVVNVKIPNKNKRTYDTYPMYITTGEASLFMFTTACADTSCDIPKKYDDRSSRNYVPLNRVGEQYERKEMAAIYDKNDFDLQEVEAFHHDAHDEFVFTFAAN